MAACNAIAEPLTLPYSKKIAPNRIVKASTTEQMADPLTNFPNDHHCLAYYQFAKGGSGMIQTGNVQVDRRYMESSRNIAAEAKDLQNKDAMAMWTKWAESCKVNGNLAIVQLSHGGRQVPLSVSGTTIGPSAIPLQIEGSKGLPYPFAKVRAATREEIDDIISRFVQAAILCHTAGFDGVQIHAAHGYLLSSFLSRKTNQRSVDNYGGNSAYERCQLLLTICQRIRATLPSSFILAIKLNSADFQRGGFSEDDSIIVTERLLTETTLDYIEYSGGTYESTAMLMDNVQDLKELLETKYYHGAEVKATSIQREAFFLHFITKVQETLHAKKLSQTKLLLTGGWRSGRAMHTHLLNKQVDLIGLGRPLCVEPTFPQRLLTWDPQSKDDVEALKYELQIPYRFIPEVTRKGMTTQLQSLWHSMQIQRLGVSLPIDLQLPLLPLLPRMLSHLYFDPQKYPKFMRKLYYGCMLIIILVVWYSRQFFMKKST
jgi:2,4-dienoyl-CoA reductase-like NADH-dependent reductase (Old Yellow Enzyme family)